MQSFIFLRSPLHDSGGHLHHIRRNTIHLASFLNRRRLSQTRNIGTFTISWNSPQIRRLPRSKAFLWTDVFEMQRRTKASSSSKPVNSGHSHDHDHDHSHSHSHGGLFHSHSHDAGHSHAGDAQATAEALTKVFKGEGLDKGTKVTLLGLFSNVGLTAVKGAAGWYFHSAALLAEAGHSLSDLLADFVALASWRTSRRPPSDEYPYGFGKFESFGTATVSILLIGGALAIGYHSYNTFLHVLAPTVSSLPPGLAHDILTTFINSNITALDAAAGILPHSHAHGHSHTAHSHGEVDLLDPNAAWFALASVIIKEWVYRVTKKVADEEKSPVLEANALHHRSDAYSSGVALIAILGTWAVPGLPLDSIGGTFISFLILQQGWSLMRQALKDLTDAGVSEATRAELSDILSPLVTSSHDILLSPKSKPPPPSTSEILGIRNVRAVRSGSQMFVDLTADVSPLMTMREAHDIEERIRKKVMEHKSEVREVRIHLHALEEGEKPSNGGNGARWTEGPC